MTASIRITSPGLSTTVQDAGRATRQQLGVPPSGAMDTLALAAANALVGNRSGSAVLEFCYLGPSFTILGAPVRLAVVGGDSALLLGNGRTVASNKSVTVQPNEMVSVQAPKSCVYGVLAISGGVDVPEVLTSRSTFLRGAFGGLQGRILQAGDELNVSAADMETPDLGLTQPLPYGEGPIRVILGPQADYFDDENLERFLSSEYEITRESDRMGMRLSGVALKHARGYDIVTDGVVNGSIQVPGSGSPVILLKDRQTVGGYPKIATVISSDLPRLGAKKPGGKITFSAVTIEEAVALRRKQAAQLQRCLKSLQAVGADGELDPMLLHSQNLISGVASGDEM